MSWSPNVRRNDASYRRLERTLKEKISGPGSAYRKRNRKLQRTLEENITEPGSASVREKLRNKLHPADLLVLMPCIGRRAKERIEQEQKNEGASRATGMFLDEIVRYDQWAIQFLDALAHTELLYLAKELAPGYTTVSDEDGDGGDRSGHCGGGGNNPKPGPGFRPPSYEETISTRPYIQPPPYDLKIKDQETKYEKYNTSHVLGQTRVSPSIVSRANPNPSNDRHFDEISSPWTKFTPTTQASSNFVRDGNPRSVSDPFSPKSTPTLPESDSSPFSPKSTLAIPECDSSTNSEPDTINRNYENFQQNDLSAETMLDRRPPCPTLNVNSSVDEGSSESRSSFSKEKEDLPKIDEFFHSAEYLSVKNYQSKGHESKDMSENSVLSQEMMFSEPDPKPYKFKDEGDVLLSSSPEQSSSSVNDKSNLINFDSGCILQPSATTSAAVDRSINDRNIFSLPEPNDQMNEDNPVCLNVGHDQQTTDSLQQDNPTQLDSVNNQFTTQSESKNNSGSGGDSNAQEKVGSCKVVEDTTELQSTSCQENGIKNENDNQNNADPSHFLHSVLHWGVNVLKWYNKQPPR